MPRNTAVQELATVMTAVIANPLLFTSPSHFSYLNSKPPWQFLLAVTRDFTGWRAPHLSLTPGTRRQQHG